MEHQGTFDKYYALGIEVEHDDQVLGFEWPNGRWDQQSGRVVASCRICGETPDDHPIAEDDYEFDGDPDQVHEPQWGLYLDFGDDALDVLPNATYVIFRPTNA